MTASPYLLNPWYTWPKVPLPRSFPFFHFDKLGVWSIPALILALDIAEGLEGEPGGRGMAEGLGGEPDGRGMAGGLVGEPGGRGMAEGLVGEPGGRGNLWH